MRYNCELQKNKKNINIRINGICYEVREELYSERPREEKGRMIKQKGEERKGVSPFEVPPARF